MQCSHSQYLNPAILSVTTDDAPLLDTWWTDYVYALHKAVHHHRSPDHLNLSTLDDAAADLRFHARKRAAPDCRAEAAAAPACPWHVG